MTALSGQHLGMQLHVDAIDADNRAYFGYCASGEFRLQCCTACRTLRFPPGPRCQVCGSDASAWTPVPGTGTIYTYTVVHQATQAHMKAYAPYAVVVVELDAQPGRPLRIPANLVAGDGVPLAAGLPREWGIGTRVRMRFLPAGAEFAVPAWELLGAN